VLSALAGGIHSRSPRDTGHRAKAGTFT
jgi:hypothetical protein